MINLLEQLVSLFVLALIGAVIGVVLAIVLDLTVYGADCTISLSTAITTTYGGFFR